MSYRLPSKSGEMLTSRDVRASVLKYMPSVPKYIFWDTWHVFQDSTSDYQLLLFALSAPTLRRRGQSSSRLVHHVCFACPSNCPRMVTIGPWMAEHGRPIIHGVPKWMPHPSLAKPDPTRLPAIAKWPADGWGLVWFTRLR